MIGKTLSHYKILEKLGEGGMGVVYKAQDLKLDRFVAIKFLAPHLSADKDAVARFIHEAKAASSLDHANIGAIHDIEETPEGQTFIVMACYEGETLRARIDRGGISVEEALEITSQIASGLSKAHELGIVHRDIKPANIILTKDGQAKIMDFGLAKLAGKTKLTMTGRTMGTVAYMSPEQAMGKEVDERSDIFSLGVVLYEMLTGHLPFSGEHEAALLYEIVHEQPDPISAHRGDVPEALQSIVTKALEKDVGSRYQKVRDMRQEIETCKSEFVGESTSGARRTGFRRSRGKSNRFWISLAVGAAIIVLGSIVVQRVRLWEKSLAAKDLSLAVIDFRDLVNPSDSTTSLGITTLVQVELTQSSPVHLVSPELLYDIRRRLFGSGRGSMAEDQVLAVAKKAGATFFLAGRIMGTVADRFVSWHLVDTKSGKSLGADKVRGNTQAEIADGIIAGIVPLLADRVGSKPRQSLSSAGTHMTFSEEAYGFYVRGLLALEAGREQDAISELEKAGAIDSTFALAYYQLAQAHIRLSLQPQGLPREYADKAWAHRSHLNNKDRMSLEAFRELCYNNIPGAMETYREILGRWPDDRGTLENLARYLFQYWYFEEALAISKRGLDLYPDAEIFAAIYENSLSNTGRTKEALEASLAYARKYPEQDHRGHIAQRYWEVGLPDSTEAINRRILLDRPGYWDCVRDIAYCCYARGDVSKAIEMLEQLLNRPDILNDQRLRILSQGWGPGLVEMPAEIGRFSKSFELLQEYRKYATASAAARVEIRLSLLKGDARKAVNLARRALEHSTTPVDSVRANLGLIEALVAADSLQEARSLLSEVLKGDERVLFAANKYLALLLRAVVCLAEKDPSGAFGAIHDCEKFAIPASGGGLSAYRYLETLAHAYRMSGQLDEAVRTYKDLLRIYGGHAISHYELGQVYEQMKRPADAKREYSKFLEMCSQVDEGWPPVDDARKRLAAL